VRHLGHNLHLMNKCHECSRERPLDPEGLCRRCQLRRGFRYCSICGQKRLATLDFYQGRSECIYCGAERRRRDYVPCKSCGLMSKKGTRCRGCQRDALICRYCGDTSETKQFFSARICSSCATDEAGLLRQVEAEWVALSGENGGGSLPHAPEPESEPG